MAVDDRRVLVAPDKFKGSLTAVEVARHLTAGLRRAAPGVAVTSLPVADGGDGTVDAAVAAGYERRTVRVRGPLGEPVTAGYALRGDTAVVELAEASGLRRASRPAPLTATSYGTGELVRAALDAGARTVVLGVGGSACTDGGAGMLSALGVRLLDADGREVGPGGAGLARLASADWSGLDPRLREVSVVLAGDVDNPLTGPEGAAAVYGPQKGASEADVRLLDAALARYARVLGARPDLPGAGAAGGVGYGALVGLGAEFRPGIEVMLEVVGFAAAVRGASLVVTGEGSLDEQTLRGKAPVGVVRAARGVPVVAVCGRLSVAPEALGLAAAYPLTSLEPDVRRCMADAGPLLERLAARVAADCLA
ncbi:glycerate kinase [Streptomyces orinoci]|uniref:Glycerate kinase n=1 Tax=Streptomyces orinoci TaxID=67339 RepID=A0ABV3JSQ0_STRON|nr:glycerate kinase [Streptomyces orinoci]